jgi:hypothetical protein
MRFFTVALVCLLFSARPGAAASLPLDKVFQGEGKFRALLAQASASGWEKLPIGPRTAAFGKALVGTPYVSHTLELDDSIEAPSVNFLGLDCWTLFEVSLAMARLMDLPEKERSPQALLHFIELDRYRDGICDGNYLSRLHYLEDWAWDNHRRGLVRDITPDLGGVRYANTCREMTVLWKSYRMLRANPDLVPLMRQHERRIEKLPTWIIPKAKVRAIESKLQEGDIIGIISKDGTGLSTSHVGLAVRDGNGAVHFLHASSKKDARRVVMDASPSAYLAGKPSTAGILVVRPLK